MIWPMTMRLRDSVLQPHDASCACVKQAAAPHGPFGSYA